MDEYIRVYSARSSASLRVTTPSIALGYALDNAVIELARIVGQETAELARSIGLSIEAQKNLPDIILVDLGPAHPLLVFIEVVATDGPVNERRKRALQDLASDAGFPLDHVAFVTAYLDRSGAAFKKTVDALAWGSYAWFVSEPDGLVELTTSRQQLE